MGSHEPDAVDLLGEALPHLVPERAMEVASEQAGCSVPAYVLDVEGLFALRLAGDRESVSRTLSRAGRCRAGADLGGAPATAGGSVSDRVGPSTLWSLIVRDRIPSRARSPARDLGDFFDYASNADGLWLVVADAIGKGNSAVALSRWRSERCAPPGALGRGYRDREADRRGDSRPGNGGYLTAVLASWDARHHRLPFITPITAPGASSPERLFHTV